MRLGLHSFSYRYAAGLWDYQPQQNEPMSAIHYLRKASDLSLDGVCLCDPRHLESLEYAAVARLHERAEGLGLYVEIGTNGTTVEELQDLVRAGHVLGSPCVRASVDRPRPLSAEAVQSLLAATAADLQQVIPVCERYGVPLVIENTPNITSRELATLVGLVNSQWVGVCFDTGNPLVTLEDPVEAAGALARLARTVHLKDYQLAARGDGFTLIGCALGEGVVDLASIMDVLSAQAPEANLNIESALLKQHVPVLDDTYLDHFPQASAEALARTLRLVRDRGISHAPALPTERDASEDEVLAEEDDLVVRSVHWVQRMLGRPEAEDLGPDE